MTFRNDRQRGEVAKVLTDRLGKGPMFVPDPSSGVPRPTGLPKSHLARVFTGSEAILVRIAWDVWNGAGHARLDLALSTLDSSNLRMVGGLLAAIGARDNAHAVDDWIFRWSAQ